MELTVLGNTGPYPGPGRATSGYLITHGDTKILVDCGSGVLSRLQHFVDINELTAVVLSHLHYDHISDLFVLRYALEMAQVQGLRNTPLALYAPQEPTLVFATLAKMEVFDPRPLDGSETIVLGGLTIAFDSTVHALPCLAMAIVGGGRRVVYSGDTELFSGLPHFVGKADLFLCEANYRKRDIAAGKPNHMSAGQAAQVARQAGVDKLLLTHLPPGAIEEEFLVEAKEHFRNAELAQELKTYSV